MNISDLWSSIYELWLWAWNWSLPISGIDIKPIQLCIGVLIVELILDICFPTPSDWNGGGDAGGEN